MKNSYKTYHIYLLLAFLLVIACDDSKLDLQPTHTFTTSALWASKDGADLALTGVYGRMQVNWVGIKTFESWAGGPKMMPGWETMTDNAYSTFNCGFDDFAFGLQSPIASEQDAIYDLYTYAYQGIGSCNLLLQNIDNVPMSEDDINIMKGETLFIRAFWYFYLAATYGDVPIVTPEILENTPDFDAGIAKNTQKEVWAQVVADCDASITAFNSIDPIKLASLNYQGTGHVEISAPLALKARTLLYTGDDYPAAAAAAKAIIDNGKYSLSEDYQTIFTESDQDNNPEIIFSIKFTPLLGEAQDRNIADVISDWASIQPTWEMINAFQCTDGLPITESPLYDENAPLENRDPRCNFILDSTYRVTQNPSVTNIVVIKYIPDEILTGEVDKNEGIDGADIVHIRFADVLLMYAEAKIEANQIDQSVLDAINTVRARAYGVALGDVDDYPEVTTMDQTELREHLRYERRVELCFENTRYFDLKRWGIAEEVLNGFLDIGKENQARVFLPHHYKWPLPQPAIDANPLLVQNPDFN